MNRPEETMNGIVPLHARFFFRLSPDISHYQSGAANLRRQIGCCADFVRGGWVRTAAIARGESPPPRLPDLRVRAGALGQPDALLWALSMERNRIRWY